MQMKCLPSVRSRGKLRKTNTTQTGNCRGRRECGCVILYSESDPSRHQQVYRNMGREREERSVQRKASLNCVFLLKLAARHSVFFFFFQSLSSSCSLKYRAETGITIHHETHLGHDHQIKKPPRLTPPPRTVCRTLRPCGAAAKSNLKRPR
jgi:hypothetical protein